MAPTGLPRVTGSSYRSSVWFPQLVPAFAICEIDKKAVRMLPGFSTRLLKKGLLFMDKLMYTCLINSVFFNDGNISLLEFIFQTDGLD